jgi:hypothetical protein
LKAENGEAAQENQSAVKGNYAIASADRHRVAVEFHREHLVHTN